VWRNVARVRVGLLLSVLLCSCTGSSAARPIPTASPERSATAVTSRTPQLGAGGASAATPPAVPSGTPNPPPGTVLLQASGDNPPGQSCCTVNQHTGSFSTSGSWDLAWTYDCSRLGHEGYLGVEVYRADGSFIFSPPSLRVVGAGGQGVQAYPLSGTFYLVVNSVCRWSLTATASARPTATPISSQSEPASGTGGSAASAAVGAPQAGAGSPAAAGANATAAAAPAENAGASVPAPTITVPSVPTPPTSVPINAPTTVPIRIATPPNLEGPGAVRPTAPSVIRSATPATGAAPLPAFTQAPRPNTEYRNAGQQSHDRRTPGNAIAS
jgi:hypothetical protein